MKFKEGDRVKFSDYVTMPLRDKMLGNMGCSFKKEYEDKCAVRGTVQALSINKTDGELDGVVVLIDSGDLHYALPHIFTVVN